jgi:hypothetical protein
MKQLPARVKNRNTGKDFQHKKILAAKTIVCFYKIYKIEGSIKVYCLYAMFGLTTLIFISHVKNNAPFLFYAVWYTVNDTTEAK